MLKRPSTRALLLAGAASLMLLALPACRQATEAAAPARTEFVWVQEVSDVTPDPAVRYGQLENGMRYAIMANTTPPGTASIRMRFDMGSLYEAEDQRGLAHFLEHMAFNGSANVPEGEMIKTLERYGLAFGPDTNAYTSFDETVYQLDLPSVSQDVVDTGLFLMRETAGNLTLAPEAIERERGVVLSEERVRNTFGLRRVIHLIGFIAPDALIKDRLPIGLVDVLKTAPAERFVDLYQRYYTPSRATLVIVGDVDPAAIETRIRETFSDWTAKVEPGKDPEIGTVDPKRPLSAAFFQDPDTPTFVSVNVVRPMVEQVDSVAKRRTDTIRALANAIVSRRLAKLSREPGSPIVEGSASYDEWFGAAEGTSLDIVTQPESWQAALNIAEQEIRRALEHGFTQAELDEQVANFRTNLTNAVDQAATRESRQLADAIAGSVNEESVFTTPQSALERFEAFVPALTPNEVADVFRAQWQGLNPLIHVSSKEAIPDAEATILAAWKESAKTPVAAPVDAGSGVFAYTDFGTPGEVATDTRVEDLGLRQVVFANNVRLTIKPTDFEDGVVRVSLRVGGGELEFPRDKDGLTLAMGFLQQGGLQAHTLDELQSLMAGRSVELGLAAGADSFGGTYSTTPEDLELQMQVAAAFLTAPGLRPDADQLARAQLKVFYPTLGATPAGVFQRDVARLLRSGDVRFGIGPLDELLKRSLSELGPVLARSAREGDIEIAIVGDVTEEAAIAAVAKTFGALPQRQATPLPFDEARKVAFPADRSPRTFAHTGQPNQALALVYWPTTDDSNVRLARTLSLLRAVMRLKLTETLREELGATYSPNAGSTTSDVFPGYGFMSASSEVEPDKIDAVYAAIDTIAASLASGGITEDERKRALTPILESIEESLEDNGTWLNAISRSQTRPTDLDRFRSRKADFEAITVAELTAAARTYLKPDAALRVRIVHTSVAGQ